MAKMFRRETRPADANLATIHASDEVMETQELGSYLYAKAQGINGEKRLRRMKFVEVSDEEIEKHIAEQFGEDLEAGIEAYLPQGERRTLKTNAGRKVEIVLIDEDEDEDDGDPSEWLDDEDEDAWSDDATDEEEEEPEPEAPREFVVLAEGSIGELELSLDTGEYDDILDELRESEKRGKNRTGAFTAISRRKRLVSGE